MFHHGKVREIKGEREHFAGGALIGIAKGVSWMDDG